MSECENHKAGYPKRRETGDKQRADRRPPEQEKRTETGSNDA